MISFFVAYLLILYAVIATGRFFRTGGKLRACYIAALAMNWANHIISNSSATIFRSGQVYWISHLYYKQCVHPPLEEFELIYLTSYSGSQESEVWGQVLCPCPMPYALCPMPYDQSYLIFLRKAIYHPHNINQLDSEGNCK